MKAVNIPTSDAEIAEACPGITIWLYRDLARLRELPKLPIAVLYETAPSFGHWIAVLETPEGVEHFDSYGITPDSELAWVPPEYRDAFAANSPHLLRLLLNDGRQINYNEYRLQGRTTATCGRWVVARCKNRRLTTSQFASAMDSLAESEGITLDEATLLFMPVPVPE